MASDGMFMRLALLSHENDLLTTYNAFLYRFASRAETDTQRR
jgi:hypothetical protein